MSATSEMTVRHAAQLAELAEIGMAIARDLRTQVETPASPEAQARAVAAFPRVARAVRQCLALEARFVRDAAREARDDAKADQPERDARRERRRTQARLRMTQIIHDRYGREDLDYNEELEAWLGDLKDCLHEDVLDPEVLDEPYDVVFERICGDLGLVWSEDDEPDEEDVAEDTPAPQEPTVLRPGPNDITYVQRPRRWPYPPRRLPGQSPRSPP